MSEEFEKKFSADAIHEKYTRIHYELSRDGRWKRLIIPGIEDVYPKDSPKRFKEISSLPVVQKPVVRVESHPKQTQSIKHRRNENIPAWEQNAIQELEDLIAAKREGIISQQEYDEELDEIREMYDI